MARRESGTLGFLPARFHQALLAEPHQQGIKGARLEPGFLGEIVAVQPALGALEEGRQQGPGLTGIIRFSRHSSYSIYVEFVSSAARPFELRRRDAGPQPFRNFSQFWARSRSSSCRSSLSRLCRSVASSPGSSVAVSSRSTRTMYLSISR